MPIARRPKGPLPPAALRRLKWENPCREMMKQSGLVSIVTPVYNGEQYISRLLDSVLLQDYPQIEMILSDDGSEDGTIRMAQSYVPRFAEKGFTLKIVSSPHKNASAAINAALDYVSGEFLVWPDGDDELMPDSVSRRASFLKAHPEQGAVRSLMEYVSEKDGMPLPSQENLGDLTKTDLFWEILEAHTFVCAGCYMLRTEAFFRIYPRRKIPEYEVGQNFQMLLPYMHRHSCATIPDKLYRVYVRADSHSRQPRTETDEEQRHILFEELVDDIVEVCGLGTDRAAGIRIRLWKTTRRASLACHRGQFAKYAKLKVYAVWLKFRRSLCQTQKHHAP